MGGAWDGEKNSSAFGYGPNSLSPSRTNPMAHSINSGEVNVVTVNVFEWAQLSTEEQARVMRRSETNIDVLRDTVRPIIEAVRDRGDEALIEFCQQFDKVTLDKSAIRVTEAEFDAAEQRLDPEVTAAIKVAVQNVRSYHEAQMPESMWMKELDTGVVAGEKTTPITSVGLYVPRGKGSFPSVMIMLSIPAVIAGVERIQVVTPPTPDGLVDDASLVAARLCGVKDVFKVGGAQAIAALAYGTESVPRTHKVIGPGNQFVSAAKRLLYGTLDVGTPAGPSESIVFCDEHADPEVAVNSLLIEAEHGPDSAALLVTHSREVAERVKELIPGLVDTLPEPRRTFCQKGFSTFGGIVITNSLNASVDFINDYAPEHLQVLVEDSMGMLPRLKNAGEILFGEHCPISLGNYTLGVNAILPTGGFAHTFSCVSVFDFLKRSSFAFVNREGYDKLSGPTRTLAQFEGFPAHARVLDFLDARNARKES
jgi:histidinol dehydrogenase